MEEIKKLRDWEFVRLLETANEDRLLLWHRALKNELKARGVLDGME